MKNSMKITIVLITLISVFACCYMPYAIIQHKEEQSKEIKETPTPQNQTFNATAYYENVSEFHKLSDTVKKDTDASFEIDFSKCDIQDSMSDENGNENISWSSKAANLEIYTESGVITAVRETDKEGKVLKVFFVK